MVDIREITLRDYLLILYKRKWVVILCMITVTISSMIFAPTPEPIYEAFTTVLIEQPASATPLLKGLSSPLKSSQLETQAELITSRTVAEGAVNLLRLHMMQAIKERGIAAEWLNADNAATLIRRSISVSRIGTTNLLVIKARSEDPVKARDIANTVAKVFVSQSITESSRETQTARQFIEKQVDVFAKRLREAEDELTKFKSQEKYTTIEKEIAMVSTIETQFLNTKLEREIAEAKLKGIEKQLNDLNVSAVPSIANIQSPLIEGLRSRLAQFELQRSLMLREYTEKHPDVVRLKAEIQMMVDRLKEEFSKVASQGVPLTDGWSSYQSLILKHIELEVEVKSLKIREDALKKQMSEYSSEIGELADKKGVYLRLSRQMKTAEETYMLLLSKLEEIKIAESMETGNVRIVDPAVEPRESIRVSKTHKGILGAFLGFFIGVGMAFLLEHLDTSLKSIGEVEKYMGLHVLGVIPKIAVRETLVSEKSLQR
ncbi:MAG TPA: GumC family protein [bacterium]|nr:GumC family protein [bacterium]